MSSTGTEQYYRERANQYDRVYSKPERQPDLRTLEVGLAELLAGRRVLELACGTGYWTQFFADETDSVVATDINASVLDVARSRRRWPSTVSFSEASAFDLGQVEGSFDAALAGFFWSHLLHDQLAPFVQHLVARLEPSAAIVLLDNRFVEGSSTPISRTDNDGNTYQTRHLDDGSSWEVLKNFPTPADLRAHLEPHGAVEVRELDYFWLATLKLPATKDL